ncbi:hypothetical protein IUY40_01505 [Flavobacterium sp. ALJ2]|uniref:hypothetical protein n=1 Tax=Flavobacterium sp. ALJ2 TaxID=2786960 RepID=UPI00189CA695|nr:hypothetical protein [Flavobacterium sp. ALJ2]MBF7090219.1 hypothetical protein [Flavobacterium sp. ALJ2]
MLRRNANPNAIDSYGNNCLNRALMDVRQVLYGTDDFENKILIKQLRSVFKELMSFGADPKEKNDKRESLEFNISTYQMEDYLFKIKLINNKRIVVKKLCEICLLNK